MVFALLVCACIQAKICKVRSIFNSPHLCAAILGVKDIKEQVRVLNLLILLLPDVHQAVLKVSNCVCLSVHLSNIVHMCGLLRLTIFYLITVFLWHTLIVLVLTAEIENGFIFMSCFFFLLFT